MNRSNAGKLSAEFGYGVDVSHNRLDDLDKLLLKRSQLSSVRALDLGCGSGGLVTQLAVAGCQITAVDCLDYSRWFQHERIRLSIPTDRLRFVECDIRDFLKTDSNTYNYVVLQRVLHYLNYSDAKGVLQQLRERTETELYIAVTGMESAIGDAYPASNRNINERFAVLPPEIAQKFFISQPVCLYRRAELIELLEETGWQVSKVWQSQFGNIKAIASPSQS